MSLGIGDEAREIYEALLVRVDALIATHMLWAPKLRVYRTGFSLIDTIIRYDVVLNDGRVFVVTAEWGSEREVRICTRETME